MPVLDDESVFRSTNLGDPFIDGIVLLWSGRPVDAEAEFRRAGALESVRGRALIADAWRDQGRHEEAIVAYETLVRETSATPREAVMTQHLGKALFAAARYADATRAFDRAAMLRTASGAEPELIESSQRAAERVRSLMR